MNSSRDPWLVPRIARVRLHQDFRAAADARAGVRRALGRWRLSALIDNVTLAVSELVTNAVRYGRPPVQLTVRRSARDVRVDVHDEDATEPDLSGRRVASADAESGRGLQIIHSIADEVGCEQVPGDGKTMYASFRLDRSSAESGRRDPS